MDSIRGTILVTPRAISKHGHPALAELTQAGYAVSMPWPGRQPDEQELLQVLPACVGYLAGVERVPRRVLEAASSLKVISRNGVGIDMIDLEAAQECHIQVLGTPGANSQGVAELALSLLLSAMRSIATSSANMKAGRWERVPGTEVLGKTLGVVGCGNIGKRLIKMALGIGMQVIGYDLYEDPELQTIAGFRYALLEDVFAKSDAISLHCPPGEKPLVDKECINTMKRGVCIINTARAALVDPTAMLEALETGAVGQYATDVFNSEPPQMDALLMHENVILTPHIGGFTTESVERATTAAVRNLLENLS
jgi:D-3-phosphoglycerate dehydrogenase / 2-oxoglutarate reductase